MEKVRKWSNVNMYDQNRQTQFEADVWNECESIAKLLVEKNRKYGDSASNPVRIFSKANNLEQLKVRIDDKLSRLRNAQDDEDEDVLTDLLGYLVLYRVVQKQNERK